MKKYKTVIWGAGTKAYYFLNKPSFYKDYDIIAIIDNDKKKWNTYWNGKIVLPPNAVNSLGIEKIIICASCFEQIKDQIIGIDNRFEGDILCSDNMIEQIFDAFRKKLNETEHCGDIRDYVEYYKGHTINVFGPRTAEEDYSKVYKDEDMPYVFYCGKRMYYPPDYRFTIIDGGEYVKNICHEQHLCSPHLYIRKDEEIQNGSVIVDAGVCEGNFALKHIDKARKCYLIEADERWLPVLKKTFKPYKDKVIFCNKYLGRNDTSDTICLDSLVKERVDFIKMDIEGAEIDALLGGKKVLTESDPKCAICSYHRSKDEEYISWILNQYGYKTEHSEGWMAFIYGEDFADTLELRRGIIYGYK